MSDTINGTDVNRRCSRCGSAVSRSFVRVFGVDNEVHGCLDCLSRTRLSSGDAARREDVESTRDGWKSRTISSTGRR